MTEFDKEFVPLAVEMLDEFGVDCVLQVKNANHKYDPTTNSRETSQDSTLTVKAVPPSISKEVIGSGRWVGEQKTWISQVGLTRSPELIESLTLPDGKVYKITSHKNIYSGTQVALIELGLK